MRECDGAQEKRSTIADAIDLFDDDGRACGIPLAGESDLIQLSRMGFAFRPATEGRTCRR
jgi:hypothetical protein